MVVLIPKCVVEKINMFLLQVNSCRNEQREEDEGDDFMLNASNLTKQMFIDITQDNAWKPNK